MADAITSALLKEADAFGVRAPEFRIPPAVQAQRDAEAAAIKARETQPNGGGAIPTATVVQGSTAGQSDPITASLMAEASGTPQKGAPAPQSRVDQIPGMTPQPTQAQESPPLFSKVVSAVKPYVENAYGFVGDIAKNALSKDLAAKEAALSVGTSLVAPIVGNLAGAAKTITSSKLGTQEGIQAGEKRAAEITNALTYQPRAPEAREALRTASRALEASKLQGMGPPEFTALSDIAAGARATRTVNKLMREAQPEPVTPTAEPGRMASVWAASAATPDRARAMAANASPEIREAVERALKMKKAGINMESLKRHVEADSLPVKVNLTEGQATGDVALLSSEQNARGKTPVFADRFTEQNKQLIENTDAIREAAAPDVFVRGKPEQGQILIDAYKAKDTAFNADIGAKYKALEQANGGQFPLDAKAFVDAADKALHKKFLFEHVPAEYRTQLERLRDSGTMTFEQFEAMRTNLARTMRSAEGNAPAAAGVIREALENMPMPQGAEHLKPLADAARQAARSRFDLLAKDPAYKAVVDGKASADAFIDKYILSKGAQLKNVQTMRENLAHDAVAQQVMASGTVDHLTRAANVIEGKGNFSQAGYNKALEGVRSKLKVIFNPEQARQLETLGNVARYTQEQPRGSFVNNSNTFVSAMAERAANMAEHGTNVIFGSKLHGVPLGSIAREYAQKTKATRQAMKSLEPGAGISLRDIKEMKK